VNVLGPKKVVLLGMMSKMPVAGNMWLVAQYLVGLRRLGYDPYYVEAHGCTPRELMDGGDDDGYARAAAFIDQVMRRFDFGNRWAYHAVHAGGRVYGMTSAELRELYHSAALIINLHGGTEPLPEHSATGRLVYLGTDPVEVELELFHNVQATIDFLAPHCAFFTWGLNYGNPDCRLPYSERFRFKPTAPPVVMDFWRPDRDAAGKDFTTVGNWRQLHREVRFQGETYYWSKHHEYLKVLDVPRRTGQSFELALSSYEPADRNLLEGHGWKVRPALDFSKDLDAYRDYLARSRGEFTVAKDQNVRLRSGWFSERSAQYLASGRPVVTQETGFSNVLPTGAGLFGFANADEAVAAVAAINADYDRHRRGALAVARESFSYEVVLGKMLSEMGV
jgi:hypothetical protein